MRPFRRLLSLLLIVGIVWFIYNDEYEEAGVKGVWGGFKEDVLVIKEHPIVVNTIDSVRYHFKNLYTYISGEISDVENPPNVDKPDLNQPDAQSFSIYNIEINDDKSDIINQFGEPNRSSINEYGVQWNTYHESYQNFVMIAYNNDDKVAGLFTNQDLFTSTEDITLSSTKEEVRSQLGEPLESIRKGLVLYRYNEDEGQDTFLLDNNYITFFYDTHQNNVIAAIQIIKKDLEEQKQDYFANPSQELKEGLEYQLFDITNAARSKFELPVLDWHDPSRKIGRDHSEDMATHNFFSHTNLENESPFDRLADGDISFQMAGENLASGQPSSIFAHQGLMNSEGHRKNILKSDFRLMSVGIAFKENGHPFYTESFLTK